MKDFKVLGMGCSKCQMTERLIKEIAEKNNIPIMLEKIEDIQKIMSYNVMATPAVVLNGKVVHAGGIPGREKIETWLTE